MMLRFIFAFFAVFGFISGSAAQQSACSLADVTVGVTDIKGEAFRGLAPSDFVYRASKGRVAIKSLSYDDGPRRVVLVLDRNRKLSADSRKAEIELLNTLLAAARPQDSFALVIARGPEHVVKFGEDHKEITEAAFQEDMGTKGKDLGVLDAVMVGVNLFGQHQPGDAIVVIASDLEGNHKSRPKDVAKALEQHGARMFGLALGPVSRGNITSGAQSTTAWGLATVTPGIGELTYETGDENFLPLTRDSGGAVLSVINGDTRMNYSMSDPKVQMHVRQTATIVANMVASFYRVHVERSQETHGAEWRLEVNETLRKNSPPMVVMYPHQLGPC